MREDPVGQRRELAAAQEIQRRLEQHDSALFAQDTGNRRKPRARGDVLLQVDDLHQARRFRIVHSERDIPMAVADAADLVPPCTRLFEHAQRADEQRHDAARVKRVWMHIANHVVAR